MPKEELDAFNTLGYTIGGMMAWPAYKFPRKMTINGARGFHPRIIDRFDLTVECVRRYYDNPCELDNEYNPLGKTFDLYSYFFELFGDFRGFVKFFLLQDLVCGPGVISMTSFPKGSFLWLVFPRGHFYDWFL